MAVDKVKALKLEDPVNGGTDYNFTPTETDPTQDHLAAKGVAFENSDNTLVYGDSGVLKLKDTEVTTARTLQDAVYRLKLKDIDLSLLTQGYVLIYNQSLDKFELKPPLGGVASGVVAGAAFSGTPQKKVTITFASPFSNTNYNITVTGEDARTWTIESKSTTSFIINSNANTTFSGNVFWQAISNGQVV